MIQITHKAGKGKHEGRTFANVASVSPLMRGMQGPDDTYNPKYSYSPDEHDPEVWELMPDFLKEIIDRRLNKTNSFKAKPKSTDDRTVGERSAPTRDYQGNVEQHAEGPASDTVGDDW